MRTNMQTSRGGMTLVEMAIAGTLTVIVFLSVGLTTRTASGTYRSTSADAELTMKAHRTLDRIAEQLIEARSSSLIMLPSEADATSIEFRRSLGWDGTTQWSLPYTFRWEIEEGELDDGLDNDGDGLVDEGQILWIEDAGAPTERRTVITRWVRSFLEGETRNDADDNGNGLEDERGFSIVLEDDVLTLRLTLERPDQDGRLLTKTVETSVVVRNGG